MADKAAVTEKQLVVFNLGEEAYAVDIAIVREIIHIQPVTRIPGTPDSIEGVINLRGSVIPIVDLRKRFHLAEAEKSKDSRIVVVNCQNQEVGVVVDSVEEVLRIHVDAIKPVTNLFTSEHLEHLLGIVKLADRLIILLDMDHVLSRQDIIAISSAQIRRRESELKEAVLA